jgi:hypothetical protein
MVQYKMEEEIYNYLNKYSLIKIKNDMYSYTELEHSISEDVKKYKIRELNIKMLENDLDQNQNLENEINELNRLNTHTDTPTLTPVIKVKELELKQFVFNFTHNEYGIETIIRNVIDVFMIELQNELYKKLTDFEKGDIKKLIVNYHHFYSKYRSKNVYTDIVPTNLRNFGLNIERDDFKLLKPFDVLITEENKFIFDIKDVRIIAEPNNYSNKIVIIYYLDIIGNHILFSIK